MLVALGDSETTRHRIAEARSVLEVIADPIASANCDNSDAFAALFSGEIDRARDLCRRATATSDDYEVQVTSMQVMGWMHDIFGEYQDASRCFEKALSLGEACGETMWRSLVVGAVGLLRFRLGDSEGAQQALRRRALQLSSDVNDPMHMMPAGFG